MVEHVLAKDEMGVRFSLAAPKHKNSVLAAGLSDIMNPMEKIAIILLSDTTTEEDLGRALHAFIYAKELSENGNEVRVILDGAGVKWIAKILSDEKNVASQAFRNLKMGVYSGTVSTSACKYCSNAFQVSEADVEKAGLDITSEYNGHPNIAALIKDGFRIITL